MSKFLMTPFSYRHDQLLQLVCSAASFQCHLALPNLPLPEAVVVIEHDVGPKCPCVRADDAGV